jgi:hypothetical protein
MVLASIENLGIFLRRRVNELRLEAAMTVLGPGCVKTPNISNGIKKIPTFK